jgi:hypothetical protein
VVPDVGAAVDRNEAVQHGVVAHFDVFVHETVGADVRAGTDPGRPGDHRRGVDPRGVVRRGMKHLDGPREIEVGI